MERLSGDWREGERGRRDRRIEKVMRERKVTKAEGWEHVAEGLQPLRRLQWWKGLKTETQGVEG